MDLAKAAAALRPQLASARSPAEVHSARKALKKLRARLRLVRATLGKKRYAQLDATLRDAGRALSVARDAEVLAKKLAELAPEAPALSSGARRTILRQRRHDHVASTEATRAFARLGPLPDRALDDPATWRAGLRRTYRDGRRALAAALERWTTDRAHALRKRAKDLRHELEALGHTQRAKQLHELGDLLGDDHDLAVLGATLEAHGHDQWRDFLAKRRKQLRKRAAPLAKELYAEKSKRFVRRVEAGTQSGHVSRAGSPA